MGGRVAEGGVLLLRRMPTAVSGFLLHFVADFGVHAVVVALRHHAGHVVHGAGGHGFDAGVGHGGIEREAAPAAFASG